jgi:mycothiol system anti-sigma-R factor
MSDDELSCEEVIEQLFTYLDRELESGRSAAIDQHLKRCRDCFSHVEFERKLRAKIRDSAKVEAPDRLQRRIRGLLDRF